MHCPCCLPTSADDLCTATHHVEGYKWQAQTVVQRGSGALQQGAPGQQPFCGIWLQPPWAPLALVLCSGPSHQPWLILPEALIVPLVLSFHLYKTTQRFMLICTEYLVLSLCAWKIQISLHWLHNHRITSWGKCYLLFYKWGNWDSRTAGLYSLMYGVAESLVHDFHLILLILKLDFSPCASLSLWL